MNKRIDFFKYLIYGLYLLIVLRIFTLQVINREYYNKILNKRIIQTVNYQSPRGKIYDSLGNLMVTNVLNMTILYQNDAKLSINEEISLAYLASNYLNLDYHKVSEQYLIDFYILTNEPEINQRISKKEWNNYNNHQITKTQFYKLKRDKVLKDDLKKYNEKDLKAIYLYYLMHNGYNGKDKVIKENSTLQEFLFFSESIHNLKGFKTEYTYKREYLYGDTLKQVLGKVGYIPKEKEKFYLNKGYSLNDKVGLSNLELIYDDYLKGKDSVYKVINDEKYLIKDGQKGNDLYLTININLQKYVEQVLSEEIIQAKKLSSTKYYNHTYVVISDTKGGILTFAGKEYFKGNIIDRSIGIITDTMTPGSAIKAASMLVGYDTKKIKIGEVLKDECIKIKNTPIKCSINTMGYINDIEALRKSSNVYQFKIAMRVGSSNYRYNESLNLKESAFDTYRDYFSRFGLGVSTGIELLNESLGYKGKKRLPGLLLDYAIGQYDTYTTLQLNQYISTISQKGNRYQMHLLKNIQDDAIVIKKYEKKILNNLNVDEKYLNRIILGLKEVIRSGTGYGYVNSRYMGAGKTGTSESFMDTNGDNIIDKETNSTSFVMFMPYNNPKYAISIASPNISFGNYYIYPINEKIIRRITNKIYSF